MKKKLRKSIHLFNELKKSGIEASFELDACSSQQYIIFESIDKAKAALPILSDYLSPTSAAAQTSGYTSIKLLDFNFAYLHIKHSDLQDVRTEILNDTEEYPYTCEVINNEIHSYLKITNIKSGEYICPASSVRPIYSWKGEMMIRDDIPYYKKYFKGDRVFDAYNVNPKADKSSLSIKFLATKSQIKAIEEKVAFYKDLYHPENRDYNFFKNNCHIFVNSLFSCLKYDAKPIEFVRADTLDFQDKGTCFQYFNAYGTLNSIRYHTVDVFNLIRNQVPIVRAISNCLHRLYIGFITSYKNINTQDEYGNTPIMNALLHSNIGEANYFIKKGADVNIENNRHEIPLHLACALKPSKRKIKLLEKLIDKTNDINKPDLYMDHIPLSFAVMHNDPKAIVLLVGSGANAHYINDVGDNLGNIAGYFEAPEAALALYKIDPEILHHDNLVSQYPIFNKALFHHSFTSPTHISAKDYDEIYCKIRDVAEYFAPIYV